MDSDDEHTPPRGLFEQPLVIEGKRMRKSVDRFGSTPKLNTRTRSSKMNKRGKGVALGSIENVKQEIAFMTATRLKPLHKVLFGTLGRASTLKQEIEQFNGFAFSVGSADHGKKKSELGRLSNEELTTMMQVLGLGGAAAKEQMINAILKFLMTPTKTATPRKRSSVERHKRNLQTKRTRASDSPQRRPAGLQLSESSSDEEPEEAPVKAVKPKKRVSFEDEHRLVRIGGDEYKSQSVQIPDEDVPRLGEEPVAYETISSDEEEDEEVSEAAKLTMLEIFNDVEDPAKVPLQWLIDEVIKQHPELSNNKQAVRENAIRVLHLYTSTSE